MESTAIPVTMDLPGVLRGRLRSAWVSPTDSFQEIALAALSRVCELAGTRS